MTEKGRKIAVLATGANGSCIAADLTRTGLDVSLIDQWPAHVEAMRANGLTIRMEDEEFTVPVRAYHLCDVCTLHEKFDLVLLTSKAYDARWLAEFIRPYLADDGLLIGVQNGMTAEAIAEIVGPERTLGCVVELSSELFTPGEVKRNTAPDHTWFGLGAFHPAQQDRIADAVAVLRHAGKVSASDDILSAKWMKLIINTMTMGLKSILGGTNEQVYSLEGTREIALRAGEEALAAGQTLGYRIVPIIGLKPEDVGNTNRLLEVLLDKIIRDVGPTARNTVLQDHLKGRYSEVDLLNGFVADENRRRGRPSPVNDMIVEITRRIHAGELKPDPANLAIINAMLGRGGTPASSAA